MLKKYSDVRNPKKRIPRIIIYDVCRGHDQENWKYISINNTLKILKIRHSKIVFIFYSEQWNLHYLPLLLVNFHTSWRSMLRYRCRRYGHLSKDCQDHCAKHGHEYSTCRDRDKPLVCANCHKTQLWHQINQMRVLSSREETTNYN